MTTAGPGGCRCSFLSLLAGWLAALRVSGGTIRRAGYAGDEILEGGGVGGDSGLGEERRVEAGRRSSSSSSSGRELRLRGRIGPRWGKAQCCCARHLHASPGPAPPPGFRTSAEPFPTRPVILSLSSAHRPGDRQLRSTTSVRGDRGVGYAVGHVANKVLACTMCGRMNGLCV